MDEPGQADEKRAVADEAMAACPTPIYHETHRYCPSCPWTEEGPLDAASQGDAVDPLEAIARAVATTLGWDPWDTLSDRFRSFTFELAEAAIAAMPSSPQGSSDG